MKKYFIPIGFILAIVIVCLICWPEPPVQYAQSAPAKQIASVNQALALATTTNLSASTTATSELASISATGSQKALHIPIITYHSVHAVRPEDTPAKLAYNVTPELFDEQLAYLKKHGYTTISFGQMIDCLNRGTTTPLIKPVVLTFDDGWHDQYTNAWPILKKYNDIATFYVYTNPIGKDERFLTWAEIKEMKKSGMIFGSHSLSHPFFSKATTEQLHKEIFDSKKKLEKELGGPTTDFATPFGYTNPAIEAMIKEAGYKTARATEKGTRYSAKEIYHLPAYFVPRDMYNFTWLLKSAP